MVNQPELIALDREVEQMGLSASDAVRKMSEGQLTSEELVLDYLKRIEAHEPEVAAWAYIDPRIALEQAKTLDEKRLKGNILGPLHGIPIGLKDIIDTADMPTENGSDLFAGRIPERDATVTRLLREAGAVILGKTVTTEFALSGARATRNPYDLKRTPGGSSSGSAAAVSDHMVPLALGSQTGGSMLRPASFCGVHGFKPSYGSVSRTGVFILSRRLDHLGVYAQNLNDLALVGDVLMVRDYDDVEMCQYADQSLVGALAQQFSGTPRLAIFKGRPWDFVEKGVSSIFQDTIVQLESAIQDAHIPPIVEEALSVHEVIMDASAAANPGRYLAHAEKLLPETVKRISVGDEILASDYIVAIDKAERIRYALDQVLEKVDALVTLSAPGEAPLGLKSTGNPVFQKIWTLTGMPAISLPMMKGPNGMPIGLQLIGRRGHDAELFRTAQWVEGKCS
ncbi:MAG: amidase [Magnetovibrio sp.]|nr:amidase [Magnetovibrio sp.]|tara:strand:- start:862 stop:2220 length:1359 start_codon:yes stop_codon:yes gene_type:complete